ncbi:hypothetical protein TNIN_22111 [Trichonephila inaurata madagascariensis]|uniref:Uncharacterized protein n=1 Tax=Trichonephila inaurata madagascariensis TaxID=2747483 RepID=A0A8X7CLB4_9ARAC|nr:hypothetical protein TNIN_22111 [Trichonephila inaurata madagascariensis]
MDRVLGVFYLLLSKVHSVQERKKIPKRPKWGGGLSPPLTDSKTDTSTQNIIPHVEFLKDHLLHHGHTILKTVKKSVKAPITLRSGVNSKSPVVENWILFSSVSSRPGRETSPTTRQGSCFRDGNWKTGHSRSTGCMPTLVYGPFSRWQHAMDDLSNRVRTTSSDPLFLPTDVAV